MFIGDGKGGGWKTRRDGKGREGNGKEGGWEGRGMGREGDGNGGGWEERGDRHQKC